MTGPINEGSLALYTAVATGDIQKALFLITQQGADVNQIFHQVFSPFFFFFFSHSNLSFKLSRSCIAGSGQDDLAQAGP